MSARRRAAARASSCASRWRWARQVVAILRNRAAKGSTGAASRAGAEGSFDRIHRIYRIVSQIVLSILSRSSCRLGELREDRSCRQQISGAPIIGRAALLATRPMSGAGQERRLALVRRWAKLEGSRILGAGCGVGMYAEKFGQFSPDVVGVEIGTDAAAEAQRRGLLVVIRARRRAAVRRGQLRRGLLARGHRACERRPPRGCGDGARARARRPHRAVLPQPALSLRDPRPLRSSEVSLRQHSAHQLAAESLAQPAGAPRQALPRRHPQPLRGPPRPHHPPHRHLSRL